MNLKRSFYKRINKLKYFVAQCIFKVHAKAEKDPNTWCFVPRSDAEDFSGNLKSVFEYALTHNIKPVILSKHKSYKKYSHCATVIAHANKVCFFKSSVIICDNNLLHDLFYHIDLTQRPIINVWHGIPIKNMLFTNIRKSSPFWLNEKSCYHVIASSDLDAISMGKCFDISYDKVHVTGLPRVDNLRQTPDFMQNEVAKLEQLVGNKKLILFAPTWRNHKHDFYHFVLSDLCKLSNFLEQHNCVLGVREHLETRKRNQHCYLKQLKIIGALNLCFNQFKNIEVLLQKASLLITDYSSCYLDFLYLNKPTISFAYDYEKYQRERGFLYPLEEVFEHGICLNFADVIKQAETLITTNYQPQNKNIFQYFYKFNDNQNTKRVFELIKNLAQTP